MSKTSKPKTLKSLALALALALASASPAQTLREPVQGRIDALYLHGNCRLDILRADRLELEFPEELLGEPQPFYQNGDRFIIYDTLPRRYTLFYNRDTLPLLLLTLPGNSARVQTNGVVVREMKDIDEFYAASTPSSKVLQDTLPALSLRDELFPRRDRRYTFADRCYLRMRWGIPGWGSSPLGGLSEEMGNAYRLRPSMSDFQFEVGYTPIMRDRFRLRLGLGYETNRLRFQEPYVVCHASPSRLSAEEWPTDWAPAEARVRTFGHFPSGTLPITLSFIPLRRERDFEVSLSLIPGWDETWTTVGLEHRASWEGGQAQGRSFPQGYNRSKLDLRIDLTLCNFGLFFQMATRPLLSDAAGDLYPFKAGIVLGI